MAIFIDHKFIGLISPKLQKFQKKRDHLYTFRCPYCGDSKKNPNKTRGYFYRERSDMFFKCHNCGIGHTLYNFLKDQDPNLCREYALERFKAGDTGHSNYPKPEVEIQENKSLERFVQKDIFDGLEAISDLDTRHYARQYLENRKIPEEFFPDLYFTEDFKEFIDKAVPNHEFKLIAKDPRIIIPFYDSTFSVIAVQGRALLDNKLRYITIKIKKNAPKIFGLDRLNMKTRFYIVEGPFDSMFLPNCIAAAGSDLPKVEQFKSQITFVYDNEPRNKEIVKKMQKLIEFGYQVCIWPDNIVEKDINDMVLNGKSPDQIRAIIDRNTFIGLRAKLELIDWKRC